MTTLEFLSTYADMPPEVAIDLAKRLTPEGQITAFQAVHDQDGPGVSMVIALNAEGEEIGRSGTAKMPGMTEETKKEILLWVAWAVVSIFLVMSGALDGCVAPY